ncbi:MAG: signal peptidase I [Candidatus Coatesbacteria bacterium]|nr:MAG: signal peptidase I [Candidatus Coatesbacteria bacterium]
MTRRRKRSRPRQSSVRKRHPGRPRLRLARDVLLIATAYVVIRVGVVETHAIPSGSDEDTLLIGDHVLTEKVTYRLRDPEPGEIATFVYPFREMPAPLAVRFFLRNFLGEISGGPTLLIKRVVGVPGDVVEIRRGVLFRNGRAVPEPYLKTDAGADWGPYIVPPWRYFMMGDNRHDSADSRYFGAVPREYVTGKAEVIYFSLAPTTCAKHRAPILYSQGKWYCSGGGEEKRPGWDFAPAPAWRFDRRVRWSRTGKLVRAAN